MYDQLRGVRRSCFALPGACQLEGLQTLEDELENVSSTVASTVGRSAAVREYHWRSDLAVLVLMSNQPFFAGPGCS